MGIQAPIALLLIVGSTSVLADGWSAASKAPNFGSVANTRHNLALSWLAPAPASLGYMMDIFRNNYGEVCVYCHTPHGANAQMGAAPLWNRTRPSTPFTLYSANTTLDRPITQPGLNSLTCLSCHDGITAIDSIVNMPGSGGYSESQQTSVNESFLSTWPNPSSAHFSLGPSETGGWCTTCHQSGTPYGDFNPFIIGRDAAGLTNDHPIGVRYPENFAGIDFNAPSKVNANNTLSYFDKNGNSFADTNEIRLYNTGEGFEVECASCHDPHGVPSAGPGSLFISSFLRVKNEGSALCMNCHTK